MPDIGSNKSRNSLEAEINGIELGGIKERISEVSKLWTLTRGAMAHVQVAEFGALGDIS